MRGHSAARQTIYVLQDEDAAGNSLKLSALHRQLAGYEAAKGRENYFNKERKKAMSAVNDQLP